VLQIRDPVLFDPWIRDPGWKKIQIRDHLFGLKIFKFFDADPYPGSEILSTLNQGWKKVG
jgi:hypothetical protein